MFVGLYQHVNCPLGRTTWTLLGLWQWAVEAGMDICGRYVALVAGRHRQDTVSSDCAVRSLLDYYDFR